MAVGEKPHFVTRAVGDVTVAARRRDGGDFGDGDDGGA